VAASTDTFPITAGAQVNELQPARTSAWSSTSDTRIIGQFRQWRGRRQRRDEVPLAAHGAGLQVPAGQ
jgi:hypothetical protein